MLPLSGISQVQATGTAHSAGSDVAAVAEALPSAGERGPDGYRAIIKVVRDERAANGDRSNHGQDGIAAGGVAAGARDVDPEQGSIVSQRGCGRGVGGSRGAGDIAGVLLPLIGRAIGIAYANRKGGGVARDDTGICRLHSDGHRPAALGGLNQDIIHPLVLVLAAGPTVKAELACCGKGVIG